MTYGRAVVVGGGIGGLITARVLSDHFAEVIVIDRDAIPTSPAVRAGIPQSSHFHALQPGGMEIMNNLIPGLEADLVAGDFPSEEQTSVEMVMKLTTLGGEGNKEAALLLGMVFSMRDSLSAIHDKERLAAVGI